MAASGEWNKNPTTVVRMPDLFNLSVQRVRQELKRCVKLCHPGPNVLLLVKPSDFTEEDSKILKFISSLFGQEAFKHSMFSMTYNGKRDNSVGKLIQDCQERVHRFSIDKKGFKQELMEKIKKNSEGD